MIPTYKVNEVRRHLAEGRLSHREIAQRLQISRNTVGGIATGKRYYLRRIDTDLSPSCSGPPVRCPGCGGLVYAPCRLCRTQALRDKK